MTIRDVPTSRLRNYENNPRNNDLAVEKVKYSIERFGFLFPVIIDMNYVIVAGHTRVRACRELGIVTVPCIIADELTEEQINLFRLIDNKTSEYSDWDFEKLKSELSQVDLTLDKNQILLERFELTAEVFDIEPEMAEIKVPSLNFMGAGAKPEPVKKPPVSTIHSESEGEDEAPEEDGEEAGGCDGDSCPIHFPYEEGDADVPNPGLTSAYDAAGMAPEQPAEAQRESKPLLPLYQFRFGDVAFFISKVELDRLNAKYAEYIDTNAALGCSFAEYLLRGVEGND